MIPLINTNEYITTLYLFRLPNINRSIAYTNEDSATTLQTLIDNNEDYYKQELTAYRVGDEDFVLNINYNDILKYNYCVLTLQQDTTHYYFFYITSYKAISVERSSIRLTLDTVTTYYKDIKENGVKGMLNRAHLPPLLAIENYANIPVINPDIMSAEDNPLEKYVVTQTELITQDTTNSYVVAKFKFDNTWRYNDQEVDIPYEPSYAGSVQDSQYRLVYNNGSRSTKMDEGAYVFFCSIDEAVIINPNETDFTQSSYNHRYAGCYLAMNCNYVDSSNPYTFSTYMKIEDNYSAYTYIIFDQSVLSLSLFLAMNPLFQNYLEGCYLLPPTYNKLINDTNVSNGYLGKCWFWGPSDETGATWDSFIDNGVGGFEGMYLVRDYEFFKKVEYNNFNVLASKINTKYLNLSSYLEEDTTRSVWEEPKLYLYPYRYNDIYFVDLVDVIIKYNDYDISYLLEKDTSRNTLMQFAIRPDLCQLAWGIVDDSPSSMGDFAFDKYFARFTWPNITDPSTTTPLSLVDGVYTYNYQDTSFITYNWSTSEYSQYRIYQKALVDASEESAKRNAILNTLSTLAGSNFLSPMLAGAVTGNNGVGIAGAIQSVVASGLNIAKTWTQYADQKKQNDLTEQALTIKPATIIGQVSKVADLFYKYDTDTPVISACYELSMPASDLEYNEHKFYEIGYNCPYMVNTKDNEDLFNYIFYSRKYFNFVSFTNVTLNSKDLAIPYLEDIENRLSQGVLFYHINDYYDFDNTLVNKQKEVYTQALITGGNE